MSAQSVQALLDDIRLLSTEHYDIVQAVRAMVKQRFSTCAEAVKYGGILFSAEGIPFGGVFAYTAHVSVEFSCGAAITDTFGLLEGKGKGRRHLKLRSVGEIDTRQLAHYLPLALQAAKANS